MENRSIREAGVPDQLFMAGKIRNIFKRTEGEEMSPFAACLLKIVEVPLNFVRDYTIPMSDFAEWDRTRAAVLPLTIPAGVCTLQALYFDDASRRPAGMVTLYCLIPGLMMAIWVRLRTTKTRPPSQLMFVYAILGFVMSILWISFTGDVVIDLIQTLGRALDISPSALGLTLVAVGNCLGDMSADVAMTKKGFGEMAITATMAGPVFNLNVGLGLAMTSVFLTKDVTYVEWSLFAADGALNDTVVIPVVLVVAVIITQMAILINGCKHDYWLRLNFHKPFLYVYAVVVVCLVVYSFAIS